MSELEKVLHQIYEHELRLEPFAPPAEARPFSAQENHDRLAAAQTPYGVGTRSYNRGAAKKEIDRQCVEATTKYEEQRQARFAERAQKAGLPVQHRKDGVYIQCNDETFDYLRNGSPGILAPLMCSCLQRDYAHELSIHENLWREAFNPELQKFWPWSLMLSPNVELSTERKAA